MGSKESDGEGQMQGVLREAQDVVEEEAGVPIVAKDPGRPTRKEFVEYVCIHLPFTSWCRHCVCGRAVAPPHKSRSDAEREFGRGMIPTISLDHCFLGSRDDDGSPHRSCLILYDNETEGILSVVVASKAAKL